MVPRRYGRRENWLSGVQLPITWQVHTDELEKEWGTTKLFEVIRTVLIVVYLCRT